MTKTVYNLVKSRRKQWTPVYPTTTEPVIEGAKKTLEKCLALRFLELDVKDFILKGLSRKESTVIGEEGKEQLLRNVEDEERHDLALTNCVKSFEKYDSTVEKEALIFKKAWVDHPDFSILKAALLENGVFFVVLPLYRLFGNSALRTTSVDISADEALHVILHRHVSKEVGFKPSKSLDELRKATVAWIIQDLNVTGYNKETFMKASDNLVYKGVAPELDFTQSYRNPAFFEHRNDTLPYYS